MTVARRAARHEEMSTALFLALMAYLIIEFMRPQDVIPGLGVIRPGLLAAVLTILLWLASRSFAHMRDSIFKWECALLAVLISGLPIVVNHRFWFDTTLNFSIFVGCLTLALVSIARFRTGRDAILKLMLLSYVFQAIWAITHKGRGTGSHYYDENDVAAALIAGGGLAYAMWLHWPVGFWRKLAPGAAVLFFVGIVATDSRGGFVGLIAAVCAVLFFSGRLLKTLLLVAVLAAASYPFVPETYKAEVKSINDPDNSTRRERIYSWNRGIDLLAKSPLIGIGAGNYAWRVLEVELTEKAAKERGDRRVVSGRPAHSLYFTLLPENGLLGVIAYFALVVIVFRRAWNVVRRPPSEADDPSIRTIAQFIMIGLIGYSVASAFVSTLWYPHFWLMTGLAVLLSPRATMDAHGLISWPSGTPPSSMRRPRPHAARLHAND